LAAQKVESQNTTDERLSLCISHNVEKSFNLKKINQNDLQEVWGDQESNWLSK
jgi:hypothetical protein